jgi:hypothetical protein
MITNDNEKICKNLKKYGCESCDYYTSDKTDFNKHLLTLKHKKITNDNEISEKIGKEYMCSQCGKKYKYASGLSCHKKKCIPQTTAIIEETSMTTTSDELNYKEMFLELMHQNKEIMIQNNKLQNTISELIPKVGNTTNTNSHNNINIKIDILSLLNDKCKDALSITDFIELIKVEVKDLLYTGEKGLTNGVSNLFLEQLNSLPLVKRPIWCSDKKRKKIFIKDDEWEEDMNNKKTKEAIKSISAKQAKNMNKYTKENPDWMSNERKKEKYIEIVKEATSDLDENKQINVINSLLKDIHLSNEQKDGLNKDLLTEN